MDTMTHWASDKALARSHPEISEEFLAKNPKAFRTIQQSLMEAFGARQACRTDKGIDEAILQLMAYFPARRR